MSAYSDELEILENKLRDGLIDNNEYNKRLKEIEAEIDYDWNDFPVDREP